MKKKILAMILTLGMAVSLAACGSSGSTGSSAASSAAEEAASAASEAVSEAAASSAASSAAEETAEAPAEDAGEEAAAPAASGSGTIVFSTKTITNNEFQRIMVEECQKAVEAAGYTFELTLSGDELAVAKQVEQVENAINRKVDGLIIAPMDGSSLIPALQKAKDAGIPVIIIDASIDEGNEDLFLSHVGSNNYAIGYEAAKQMVDKIGEGKVCTVRGAAGAMGGELRAAGFEAGIKELGGGKVQLVNQQNGNWLSDVAMQVTENMLASDPDMAGIFLCSDGMLSGVISAVQNRGLNPADLCIISVDGNISALDAIKKGDLYGCVAQYPGKEGQISGEIMTQLLSGEIKEEEVEKETDPGYFFMSPDNIEESESVAY
ncbi:MAG: sugar ABC transporter substrate-binding protein [Eubacterium sp.]|nr:sugar ABC transporter substrate-binding protein [Eubacterium sp.]